MQSLKYRSGGVPNGLIANMYGPVEGSDTTLMLMGIVHILFGLIYNARLGM